MTHISTQIIFILMLGATIFLFRLFFLDAHPILHCDEFQNLFPGTTKVKCLSDAGLFRECLTSIFHPIHVISIIIITGFLILKLILNCFPLQL
jgi:hypothetical protein